ncbi:MAG: alpha/beta hydrolase family protein [Acutalibacteraceae bacterium]|jgi:dienelactone hydrolase
MHYPSSPIEKNRAMLRSAAPLMAYKETDNFGEWQIKAREKLNNLLGLPFEECEDNFTITSKETENGISITYFVFQSEADYYVRCAFITPENATKPLPLAICLQGHSKGMHISLGKTKYPGEKVAGDRDFAIQAGSNGFCALAIEQRNFGECGGTPEGPDCYLSAVTAMLTGRTTIGERVWDIQRAIDVVEKYFPQANLDQIVCVGNSGGGTATYYAACLDERIAIAVPSCSVCTFADSIGAMHHCACNYVPNIANFFEMGDLAGMIAPRPLIVIAGKQDNIFPKDGVEKCFMTITRLYKAAGAENNCRLIFGDEGHRFYAEPAWKAVFDYFKK